MQTVRTLPKLHEKPSHVLLEQRTQSGTLSMCSLSLETMDEMVPQSRRATILRSVRCLPKPWVTLEEPGPSQPAVTIVRCVTCVDATHTTRSSQPVNDANPQMVKAILPLRR